MGMSKKEIQQLIQRGPFYCFWRHGLMGFGVPVATLASVAKELMTDFPSFVLSRFLPDVGLALLIGAPVAGLLYSIDLWKRAEKACDEPPVSNDL